MTKTHTPYTPELRRQLVEMVRAGRSPEDLANEYEPSLASIRNWVRADSQKLAMATTPPSAPNPSTPNPSAPKQGKQDKQDKQDKPRSGATRSTSSNGGNGRVDARRARAASKTAASNNRTDRLTAPEREELTQLRRENHQLRLERGIIAKAAAWARELSADISA
jgi:transposase-like protein